MDRLPIYDAVIDNEYNGIIAISLVDYPAVESDFVCFSKNEKKQMFSIENEEERIITGVLMNADVPIYRYDEWGEYYVNYSKETIKQMAINLLKDGAFKNISFQHDGELLPQGKIEMIELFIKNDQKGISPNYVDNVKDGSLMISFKVNDDEIWNECKNGDYLNGFSLEGWFTMEQKYNKHNKKNNFKMKLKQLLKSILTQFGMVETQECTLYYEGDEIAVGVEVFDENGDAIANGEYHVDDKVIIVKDGKVEEIKETEEEEVIEEPKEEEVEMEETTEEEVKEEPKEEEVKEEPAFDVESEIANIKEEIENIKKTLEELVAQPAEEPIVEKFNKVAKVADKYAKLAEYGKAIR